MYQHFFNWKFSSYSQWSSNILNFSIKKILNMKNETELHLTQVSSIEFLDQIEFEQCSILTCLYLIIPPLKKLSVRRRKKSCGIIQTIEDQYVLGKFYLKKRRWSICFWVFSSFFFQFAVWDWYLSCILWHYTFMYLGNTPKNNCLLLQVFRL